MLGPAPLAALNRLLEEVDHLFAPFFGIVNRRLAGFFRALGDILSGVFGGAIGHLIGFLGAVLRFYGDGLGSAVDVRYGDVGGLQSALTDVVDLLGRLLAALLGVMDRHLAAFLHAVESFLGGGRRGLPSMNRRSLDEVKRVLGSIRQLDDHGL